MSRISSARSLFRDSSGWPVATGAWAWGDVAIVQQGGLRESATTIDAGDSRRASGADPGGRASASVAPSGEIVDDFLIQEVGSVVNVGNAPSPAATSALNIGDTIVDRLASRLD